MARYIVWQPAFGDHWRTFDEVAACLVGALGDLGHDAILGGTDSSVSAIEEGAQYIVLAPHLFAQHGVKPPKGSILYNLEQVSPESSWFASKKYERLLKEHRVWDYSEKNTAALRAIGVPVEAVVPFAYHEALDGLIRQGAEKIYDVAFVGSMNERRSKLLDSCRSIGLSVATGFGMYGQDRNDLYAESRVVLNAHFYESSVFEVVRVLPLLANGCLVATEGGDDEGERPYRDAMLYSSSDGELRDRIYHALRCGGSKPPVESIVEASKSVRLIDALRFAGLGAPAAD